MNNESSPADKAAEIVALFERAESKIKTLELLQDEGLFYHPVNQLRYAGFHIVCAIKSTGKEEWKHARRHCQRGIYDASEMALVYCIAEINGFQQDYKKVDIAPTVNNYLDFLRASVCLLLTICVRSASALLNWLLHTIQLHHQAGNLADLFLSQDRILSADSSKNDLTCQKTSKGAGPYQQ